MNVQNKHPSVYLRNSNMNVTNVGLLTPPSTASPSTKVVTAKEEGELKSQAGEELRLTELSKG